MTKEQDVTATERWPSAIAFADGRVHGVAVQRFWRALIDMQQVLETFRTPFVGKSSPVHLSWGALDLAHTRFSGRTAPHHPGGAPNCGLHVMWEAYSHEVSSCGYWPGPPGDEGIFYAYAYPEPPGYRDTSITPPEGRWDDALGEFILPYESVRTSPDPDATRLDFLQSTYAAAANAAGWDRTALERQNGAPHHG